MNFFFKIDENLKFGFRNEVPILKDNGYIPAQTSVSLINTISYETSKAEFISFENYFKEEI